jgi:hypothetical protein
VPEVQLAEVTVTAKAEQVNNEIAMTESENNHFKTAFNIPAVSVGFTWLAGIISLFLYFIFLTGGQKTTPWFFQHIRVTCFVNGWSGLFNGTSN